MFFSSKTKIELNEVVISRSNMLETKSGRILPLTYVTKYDMT